MKSIDWNRYDRAISTFIFIIKLSNYNLLIVPINYSISIINITTKIYSTSNISYLYQYKYFYYFLFHTFFCKWLINWSCTYFIQHFISCICNKRLLIVHKCKIISLRVCSFGIWHHLLSKILFSLMHDHFAVGDKSL